MGRTGMFGGSFNPVHVAHLILAERVLEARRLDRVLLIPAKEPPHKPPAPLAPAEDRLRMVQLAVEDNPALEADPVELRREGPSYTLRTVRGLRERYGLAERLFLLMGADSLLDLPNWWHAEQLARKVPIIAFGRPGHRVEQHWQELAGEFGEEWVGEVKERMVDAPLLEVSASEIRERLSRGLSVRYLVPESVRHYILERGLYREG